MNLPGSSLAREDYEKILAPRWIDAARADRAILRSVDSHEGGELIGRNGAGNYQGIAIGIKWPGEDHVREWILRRNHPDIEVKSDGTRKPKGKYLCPPGRGNLAYFPPDAAPELLADTAAPIWISEGPLKALALWRLAWHELGEAAEKPRALPMAINGVWGFRGTIGKTTDADGARVDEKGVISDFLRITWNSRRVVIIFDADVEGNASVEAARRELTRALQDGGATVAWFQWPKDRPPEAKGIDDFLADRGPEETLKLIAAASVRRARKSSSNGTGPLAANPHPDLPQFSEENLALRFSEQHADNLRYVAGWGKWLRWSGHVWRTDDTLNVFDASRAICRAAAAEVDAERQSTAVRLASAKTVAAVEHLARSDRRHAATVDQWDANTWILNTPSGVVDLHTGTLRSAQREDYATKSTAVGPAGDCPLWLKFLDRVTGGDASLQAFIKRMVGYALTGSTREHALFFLYGTGGNGKGVFISTISGILDSYAKTAPIEAFIASKMEHHPTDLAGLQGARLASVTETEEGRQWAEAKIKALTGGDRIPARFMRQDFFEFVPQFKLLIAGNHKPGLRSVDEAIRRRFNLVPFTVTIPATERDKKLTEKLRTEWSGILQWAIEGCVEWQRDTLDAPAVVRAATEAYLTAEDSLAAWIDDCCVMRRDLWTCSAALFTSWSVWGEKNREHVGTQKRFSQKLEERGFEPHRSGKARGFIGLALREDA